MWNMMNQARLHLTRRAFLGRSSAGMGDPKAFVAALAAIQDLSDGCKDRGGVVNPPN
jgi:hypothetical protein